MREAIRDLNLWHQTQLILQDIARKLDPLLRGWIEYYGRYASSALYPVFRHVNLKLRACVMRKFKRFKYHTIQASMFLQNLAEKGFFDALVRMSSRPSSSPTHYRPTAGMTWSPGQIVCAPSAMTSAMASERTWISFFRSTPGVSPHRP